MGSERFRPTPLDISSSRAIQWIERVVRELRPRWRDGLRVNQETNRVYYVLDGFRPRKVQSVRVAGDTSDYAVASDVEATTAVDVDSDGDIDTVVKDTGGTDVPVVKGDTIYVRVLYYSEKGGYGDLIGSRRLTMSRAPSEVLAGTLRVVPSADSSTVDLFASVVGPTPLFPVSAEIYQYDPRDSPPESLIVTHSFGSPAEIGPSTYPAMNDIALPPKQTMTWRMKLTDVNGNVHWLGFTAADRDKEPDAKVSLFDYEESPGFIIEYDDDVSQIEVAVPASDAVPSGGTKTWGGLTGGGTKTYEASVTDLDGADPAESPLSEDEKREPYVITIQGNGFTKVVYRGPLHGKTTGVDSGLEIRNVEIDFVNENNKIKVRISLDHGVKTEALSVQYSTGEADGVGPWLEDVDPTSDLAHSFYLQNSGGGSRSFDPSTTNLHVSITPWSDDAAIEDAGNTFEITVESFADTGRVGGRWEEEAGGTEYQGRRSRAGTGLAVSEHATSGEPQLDVKPSDFIFEQPTKPSATDVWWIDTS